METTLKDIKYDFITHDDKTFIIRFDTEMEKLGYTSGGIIGNGYCWGRYMVIYKKSGGKDKQGVARIYIRDNGLVLRLYLNKINKHSEYLENTESFIREPFIRSYGDCKHCHNEKDGKCKFRKTYTLEGREISKCNGLTFEFWEPDLAKLPNYIELLRTFFPGRK